MNNHLDTESLDLHTIDRSALHRVVGGQRVNPAGGGAMNVMTAADNPGRVFNRTMESLGMSTRVGTSGSPGQSYTPAQARSDGSIQPSSFGDRSAAPPRSE